MLRMKPLIVYVALALLFSIVLIGCGAAQYPMVTSLGDLRSERRISESEVFFFQEIITLDGSNPTQLVGRPIHYGKPYVGIPSQVVGNALDLVFPLWTDGDLNPSTAFPMEHVKIDADKDFTTEVRNDTYRRIGSCQSPGEAVVRAIAGQIDKVQMHTLSLVDLRLQLAQALVKGEPDTVVNPLRDKINEKRNEIAVGRENIHKLISGERVDGINAQAPAGSGILIVRWASSEEGGLSIDAGDAFGKGGFQASRRRSGYVILGGIEISQLVVGQDLLRDLHEVYSGDDPSLEALRQMLQSRKLGFTTFTLKAKDIAYASDLQAEFAAYIRAELSKDTMTGITELDKVTVQAELRQAADLSNIGALPALSWSTEQVLFGEKILPSRATDTSGNLKSLSPEFDRDSTPVTPSPNAIKGWSTIYSVVAIPKHKMLHSLKMVYTPNDKLQQSTRFDD